MVCESDWLCLSHFDMSRPPFGPLKAHQAHFRFLPNNNLEFEKERKGKKIPQAASSLMRSYLGNFMAASIQHWKRVSSATTKNFMMTHNWVSQHIMWCSYSERISLIKNFTTYLWDPSWELSAMAMLCCMMSARFAVLLTSIYLVSIHL